jgi:hypothetical protein
MKTFSTGKDRWDYNSKMMGHKEWHIYLGPCPACGSRTFDYGGGWRCLAMYCGRNASNPAPNVGPRPDWWEENIQVFKDGDAWCAVYDDFINLQESVAGFGNNPDDAVNNLKLG